MKLFPRMRAGLAAACVASGAFATLLTPTPASANPCIITCTGPCVIDTNTGTAKCDNCSFSCLQQT